MAATSFQQCASRALFYLLALMPVLAVYAPIGMTPLAIVAALLSGAWVKEQPRFPLSRTFWIVAAALIAWGVVTAFWSIQFSATLIQAARLSGMLVAAWALHRVLPTCPAPLRLLLGGFALGLAAVWIAHVTHGASLGKARPYWGDHILNRGICVLAMLLWPLLGLLWQRLQERKHRILAGLALVVATACTVLPMESQSATMGVLAGIIATVLTAWNRNFARAFAVLVPLCALAMLVGFTQLRAQSLADGPLSQFPQSALHRLYIWEFATSRAMERPLLGWGLGSSRYLPGGQGVVYPDKILLPLHPHNSTLQLWVELGVPGVIAFLAAQFFLFGRIAALSPPWAACATGMLVSYIVIGLTAYGIWQEWWIATGILSSAAFTMFMRATYAPAGTSLADPRPQP